MFNTRVIGLAEYRISAGKPGVLTARYLTAGSRALGSGRARGEATSGSDSFAGLYRIQYVDDAGKLTGDLDLQIQRTGEGYRLTWRHRPENVRLPVAIGEVVYEGIGFLTSADTMAITYWMAEKPSSALELRPLL
ncbi:MULTISPECIES: hypothetical protein [unclassified Mycobacterium]|uniref:hypothetical protein n=1 Tax=unclassified Mycobacterium TaxID=2642494 RepID=UPI00274043EF|nr:MULTISPECIES: hypothetical protein [unclassified Mycobacterium]MDP7701278.1 hypothetical protein [Mycobacterium sp. TY815]MDP7724142.1 hypothetical protein [Mycobacterium sp. TY814]